MALEMEQLLQEAQDAAEEAEINEAVEQEPNIKTNDPETAHGKEYLNSKWSSQYF